MCQSMWQCMNHGPTLSVLKRIVTLSPAPPMLTTSRCGGFTKLYFELPALRTTENACYPTASRQLRFHGEAMRKGGVHRADGSGAGKREEFEDGNEQERCCGGRTGPPRAPPGKEIWTTLFGGSENRLPSGRSSAAVFAPLRICSSTGTWHEERG